MAAQSGRFQASMHYHVAEMTKFAAEAALLQKSAMTDASEAAAESTKSAADETESQALEERAAALEVEAEALEVAAAKDEETAEGLEVKVGEEQVEAELSAVRAAADEGVADEEEAVAGEAAISAARFEAEELDDGAAVVLCEFLPLVDIVCDVIGGIAEVSLAAAAAAEVAEAVAATSAAAAAREDEKVAATKAAESEVAAAVDGNAAAALESKAGAEEAEALFDQEEAKRDEAEALALQVEAQEAESLAIEAEAKASAEEVDADVSMEKSAQQGLFAAQKALLSSAIGILALAYFGIKVLTRILGGVSRFMVTDSSKSINNQRCPKLWMGITPKFMHDLSYTFLHVLIFFTTTELLLNHIQPSRVLDHSVTYAIRSQGGLMLIFGLIASTLQLCLLHVLPNTVRHIYFVWELVALFPFLVILFTMEALIVLVNLRRTAIGSEVLKYILLVPVWLMCFTLMFFTAIHLFVIPVGGEVIDQVETDNEDNIDSDVELSEQTLLLRPIQNDTVTHRSSMSTGPNYAWRQLLIPMEILLLSCLAPILVSCFSHAQVLLPLLQHWVDGYEWMIPVIAVVYVGLISMMVFWSSSSRI